MTDLASNVVLGNTGERNAGAGYAVVRGPELALRPVEGDGLELEGLQTATLLSREHGSVHMEVAVSELAPGGVIAGHLHPFEESFYLLSGRALLAVGGERYALQTDDFGYAPVSTPHAWHNPYDSPARWLRVRAPQPRRIGGRDGTYPSGLVDIPTEGGRAADEADPTVHFAGHFLDADLNAPGPLSMHGYHGHNIRDISVRMMVDPVLGAVHHTLFTVQFATRADPGISAQAKEHFHPFEEIYFLTAGQAQATLAGDRHDVAAGDLVWAGTNTSHGYVNTGDVPVRWLEVQAPSPPPTNAFFFDDDWRALEARRGGGAG